MDFTEGRLHYIFSFFLLIIFAVNLTYSQEPDERTHYKPPKLIFELCGTFDDPTGSASGDVKDFFKFYNLGTTYGLGFHINIKYAANKKATLYPFVTAGFTQLQNDDGNNCYIDSNKITGGYPLPGSSQYNSTPGSCLLVFRTVFAGAGLHYYFDNKGSFLPYAGAELDYNYIWGYYIQNPRIIAGDAPAGSTTFDIKSASRFGFSLNLGTDLRINNTLGFVIGANYRFANLLGKKSERSSEANTINLLDKADTSINTNLNSSRNMEYVEFYLGFTIYAGRK
jgi:opacity protein-like surface antigen